MRTVIILFLLFTSNLYGQEIYYSPYSMHLPTGIKEDISRTIYINDEQISVESDAGFGLDIKDIQIMIINDKEVLTNGSDVTIIYHCTSEDGIFPSLVSIENNPSYIEVIQPSSTPGQPDVFHLVLVQAF